MTIDYTAPPPPPPPPPPAAPSGGTFDFGKPFAFVFEDPGWLRKILIGGVFYLLGMLLIGWFFVLGYLAKLTRNVIAGVERPLPEWDDLGGYFGEGVKLFLVAFLYTIPLVVILLAIVIPLGILDEALDDSAAVDSLIMLAMCCMVPLFLVVSFIVPAALLRVIATGQFGAGFEFGAVLSFIKANLGNYLLAIVVHLVANFLSQFGIILCCIGLFFTAFWSVTVSAHAFGQAWKIRRA